MLRVCQLSSVTSAAQVSAGAPGRSVKWSGPRATNGKWRRVSLCLGPETKACFRAAVFAIISGGPARHLIQEFAWQWCLKGYCWSGMGCGKEKVAGGRVQDGGQGFGDVSSNQLCAVHSRTNRGSWRRGRRLCVWSVSRMIGFAQPVAEGRGGELQFPAGNAKPCLTTFLIRWCMDT